MIHPWRVSQLINDPELRVLLQPALCFPAFVDNVVVHDQRDGFRPPVRRFKPLQQADEQRRTFAVTAHVADFARSAVQCFGQIVSFVLARRHHAFLLPAKLLVRADFGIKMDIHLIFIKYRVLCAACVQYFVNCRHLFILSGSRIHRVGATLHHTSPADGNQRRTVPACNWQPVISLIFIVRSSVLQRERW